LNRFFPFLLRILRGRTHVSRPRRGLYHWH
jgi:hypothetical protein